MRQRGRKRKIKPKLLWGIPDNSVGGEGVGGGGGALEGPLEIAIE